MSKTWKHTHIIRGERLCYPNMFSYLDWMTQQKANVVVIPPALPKQVGLLYFVPSLLDLLFWWRHSFSNPIRELVFCPCGGGVVHVLEHVCFESTSGITNELMIPSQALNTRRHPCVHTSSIMDASVADGLLCIVVHLQLHNETHYCRVGLGLFMLVVCLPPQISDF